MTDPVFHPGAVLSAGLVTQVSEWFDEVDRYGSEDNSFPNGAAVSLHRAFELAGLAYPKATSFRVVLVPSEEGK